MGEREDTWTIAPEALARFSAEVATEGDDHEWYRLRRKAEQISLAPGFDRLITLDANAIQELPHQIEVAKRVLRRPMAGRAILADEVGLGKTIEAGIILKELTVRGLARRVLIIAPPSLTEQWQAELESKFFERFEIPEQASDWKTMRRAIVSFGRLTVEQTATAILEHHWDLVIVDEAHKAKNHETKTYQFLQRLERNYVLLLTATPLQNDLRELYNLVTLLRPGQLGTWRHFRSQYLARGDTRTPKDPDALRELTSQVMVRTRRSSVSDVVTLPARRPRHPRVELTPPEAGLYRDTTDLLRRIYREGIASASSAQRAEDAKRRTKAKVPGNLHLLHLQLCRRLCSSPAALAESLQALTTKEEIRPEFRREAKALAERAGRVPATAKLGTLAHYISNVDDHVLVFSEHIPTITQIKQVVEASGRQPFIYSGGLSSAERARRVRAFRDSRNGVLVATKAGTEGLNLQFCAHVVNFELPWNPMLIEQRIGRLHRIGQQREVQIINLAAADTIEAHVLRLLDQKIKLFELVVGELDVILGKFGDADSLEDRLVTAWLGADSDGAFETALSKIEDEITVSHQEGKEQERFNSEIAVEDGAMRLEREFYILALPARIRLGYGTRHLTTARGVDAKRQQLGLHVREILESLEGAVARDAGRNSDYGALQEVTGVTGDGRAVHLWVQGDRLPMTLVDVDADRVEPAIRPGRVDG